MTEFEDTLRNEFLMWCIVQGYKFNAMDKEAFEAGWQRAVEFMKDRDYK